MNVSMTLGKNQDKTSGSFSPLQTWRDRGQLRQFAPVAQLKIPHENRLEYIHDLLISPLHDFSPPSTSDFAIFPVRVCPARNP